MSISDSSMWAMLGSSVSTLLAVALEVVMLVVALTTVRRRRADAGGLLAASAGIQLVASVSYPVVLASIRFLITTSSTSDYMRVSTAIQLVMSVIRAAAGVLLILGIIRLATPPPQSPSPYG